MRSQTAHLARLAHLWLLAGTPSADQVAERVIVDRLLRALPRTQRRPVSMRNPLDIAELVEAIKLAEASIARDAGERAGLAPRRVMEWRPLEGIRHTVSRPTVPKVIDVPMPSKPQGHPARAWMAGCILHHAVPTAAPGWSVKVDSKTISAVLDSSSSVRLAQPSVVKPWPDKKTTLPITCVHGDTRYTMHISTEHGSWPIEDGIVADILVPLLLFDRLLSAVV